MTSQSDTLVGGYAAVSYPLNDWIVQYLSTYCTEEAKQELLSREDFVAIPIPRTLLANVGNAGFGGINDFTGGASDDSVFAAEIDTLEARGVRSLKVQNYDKVTNVFRSFLTALASGDDPTIRPLIHDDYADDVKRDKDALIAGMLGVASSFNNLNVIPVNAKELEVVGNTVVASVEGAWEAQIDNAAEKTSQFFSLDVVFTPDTAGQFLVSDIIHK